MNATVKQRYGSKARCNDQRSIAAQAMEVFIHRLRPSTDGIREPARFGAGAGKTVNFLIEARATVPPGNSDGVKWLP